MPNSLTLQDLIVFEDEVLLVFNKPAGWSVHGDTRRSHERTALSLAQDYLERTQPELLRQLDFSPSFMHRLDKDTSGILVLAKTQEALRSLNRQLALKQVAKRYLALVRGELSKKGSIKLRLSKVFDRRSWKEVMIIDRQHGMHAQTDYRVLERFTGEYGTLSLVEAQPVTGRTHQIRVHFAGLGHPVLGDVLYGDPVLNRRLAHDFSFERQFLHCALLQLIHPTQQIPIALQAAPTLELARLLAQLRTKTILAR